MWIDFVIDIGAEIVEFILELCLEKMHWRARRKKTGCIKRDDWNEESCFEESNSI